MLKVILLIAGLAGGAGGATAWLLSEPEPGSAVPAPGDRLGEARQRFQTALAVGKAEGAATESRMRQQLDAYRTGGGRPAR